MLRSGLRAAFELVAQNATNLRVRVMLVVEGARGPLPHRGLYRGRRLVRPRGESVLPTRALRIHLGEDQAQVFLPDWQGVVRLVIKDAALTELVVSDGLVEPQVEQSDRI